MARDRRRRHAVLGVAVGAVLFTVAACASPGGARAEPSRTYPERGSSTAAATPQDGMRPGVFPTTRVEPPTDADRPDGPRPTPDDALTAADLRALIRLDASAPSAPGRCTPDDVRLDLGGIEPALGHRYSQILLTNDSGQPCTVLGWPGLGFRGEWGTAFALVAERDETPSDRVGAIPQDPAEPVTLQPGGRAVADLEWTGALAGAAEESVSLFAVQLVDQGPTASLPIRAAEHVDIGETTTVRVRSWAPAP